MKDIFPDLQTYETCRSARERTFLLPIYFNTFQYDDEESTDAEIGHKAGVFSHLLFLLCLELFCGAKHGCINIVVICMLKKVAEHLRAFLRWTLSEAMERLRASLGWWEPSARYHNFDLSLIHI